jgi:hypothetical protein
MKNWHKSNISFHKPEPAPKPAPEPRAWIIDPEHQSVTLLEKPNVPELIDSIVGEQAEMLTLDHDNVVYVSDVDGGGQYAFYFERMFGPFSQRRYSKGLLLSFGEPQTQWGEDTISYYLRFLSRKNPYQPLDIKYEEEK